MKEIQVGLIGFGTVGSGLAEVLLSQQERLAQRSGLSIRLAKVADSIDAGGVRLGVVAMDGLRIERVSLTPLPRSEDPATDPLPSD